MKRDTSSTSTPMRQKALHNTTQLSLPPSQILRPRLTIHIQIRLLPNPHHPIPKSIPKSLVIKCRRMESTSIVPNLFSSKQISQPIHRSPRGLKNRKRKTHRQIILIPPLKPHSQIMILQNHIPKPLQQRLTLLLKHLIDPLREGPQSENTLPARHRVCPDDGMHSLQFTSDIERRTTRFGEDFHFFRVRGCGFEESITDESRGEGFEEFLIGAGEAVVDFVAGGPTEISRYQSCELTYIWKYLGWTTTYSVSPPLEGSFVSLNEV